MIMKKLIAVLTLVLAFTVSANAQDKKLSPAEAGKNEAVELTQFLGLTQDQQVNFTALFTHKHESLQDPNLTAEGKKELSRIIGLKINATIDGNQQQKLESNPELLKRLTE